jgi:hypothetical protein
MPHPLLPFRFPANAPPVGGTFGGSAGMGIGLDILAILTLLSILSRIGGSLCCPRDVFRLISSPRLVSELPG